eukprot:663865-Rhodomonas_salina.2
MRLRARYALPGTDLGVLRYKEGDDDKKARYKSCLASYALATPCPELTHRVQTAANGGGTAASVPWR